MSYSESDIVYERPNFWVFRVKHGYEVYRIESTHSVRCAQIGDGPAPNLGLARAIAECDRRQNMLTPASR